jgi:hypothetical protein
MDRESAGEPSPDHDLRGYDDYDNFLPLQFPE